MKKYYTHNGKDQAGPFTLEELTKQNINSSTMIWYEGIENWVKAGDIEELKSLVTIVPPPFKKAGVINEAINETINKTKKVLQNDPINQIEDKIPDQSKRRTFKWVIVILAVIGCISVVAFLINKSSLVKPSIEESLLVEDQEGTVYYENYYKYWHIDFRGQIVNRTKDYRIKDFVVEAKIFSESNTELFNKKYVIYKSVDPQSKLYINSEFKESFPQGSEILEWKIVDATFEKVNSAY